MRAMAGLNSLLEHSFKKINNSLGALSLIKSQMSGTPQIRHLLMEARMLKIVKSFGLKMAVNQLVMLKTILLAIILLFSGVVANNSFAAELKIGYVDLNKALNDSKRGREAKAELEALVREKQSQIDELEKKINNQRAEFEKQAGALSEQARQEKQSQIEKAIQDYQRLVQEAQSEIEKKRRDLTTNIIKELKDIIEEIGKKEGYAIILESSEGLILYSKEGLDLTNRIIKIYDERQKK